jgi:soluble lytic murein transglycosylase-like protein
VRPLNGALASVALSVGAAAPLPACAESVADWRPYIVEASTRFDVPEPWIERVMSAESRGRTTLKGRPITSSAGAMGLMQLMPPTWARMRASLRLGADPYDPHDNIIAGTAYLRILYDRFGYPGLFAAYNAGPTRYAEYLTRDRALPSETRNYVAALIGAEARSAPAVRDPNPGGRLFVALGTVPERSASGRRAAIAHEMFVVLDTH